MGVLTEPNRRSDVVKYEVDGGNHRFCRKNITIANSTPALVLGAVLGQLLIGITAAVVATEGNTGDGALVMKAADQVGPDLQIGAYVVRCITAPSGAGANDAVFAVFAPDGKRLADATQAVAYAGVHINFTIGNVAAVDFVVGDEITVTVAEGSGEYRQIDFAAESGAEVAAGVYIGNPEIDTSAGGGAVADALALVRGPAIVDPGNLVWPAGATADQKAKALAELEAVGILAAVGG